MNSWKSSSFPACGVAVINSRCRAILPKQQTQLIPLGQFAFLADVVGAHPVRLVHQDQIPVRPAPARR